MSVADLLLVSCDDICMYLNVDRADSSGVEPVLSHWQERSTIVEVEYDILQSVLMQRCTLAHLCIDLLPSAAVTSHLHSVFEDWATAARKAGRFQVGYSLLT